MTVAWPPGEFGGMGLEGAVKLAYRKELDAIEDAGERKARFDAMVADAYERGTALDTASYFEIDDVVDPAATRALVAAVILRPEVGTRDAPTRRFVDAW
jgi:acetyl-CoA carboxylase carboxyltransferase component